MRRMRVPEEARAAAAQKRAAAALPRWRSPVGEGAKRPRVVIAERSLARVRTSAPVVAAGAAPCDPLGVAGEQIARVSPGGRVEPRQNPRRPPPAASVCSWKPGAARRASSRARPGGRPTACVSRCSCSSKPTRSRSRRKSSRASTIAPKPGPQAMVRAGDDRNVDARSVRRAPRERASAEEPRQQSPGIPSAPDATPR